MPNNFSNGNGSLRSLHDGDHEVREPGRVAERRPAAEHRSSQGRDHKKSTLFAEYLRTASRHRWMIAGFALTGVLLSFLMNFGALPYYRARTSLDIQNINGDFMNMRSVAPTGDAGASTEVNVQTQVKLLQSDSLLQRTVERLRTQPPPPDLRPNDLASRMERLLHIGRDKTLSYNDLVDDTSKRVLVKPLGVTRLVEITCDSWNAEFAAKFCNTLTKEFKEADLETRGSEADRTSQWLAQQVADIKLKAEESQRKLVAATGGNGLILSQDSNTVGEDHLRQLQSELVRAQADRMEKEAQLRIVGTAAPGTTPGILDSPEYRSYEQKLSDLRSQVAQLVPPLTEENPRVMHLRSQIREVEAGMAAARSTHSDRMQNEYQSARHREALLKAAFMAQEGSVSADLGKAAQVNLLRREVESEQQLYQTMLQRAKEAGFASAMQASTARVVDAARKPLFPFSPKRGGAAAAGLLIGSLCGVGLAFYKDRTSDVFRVPGDVERYLHVTELGVIPTAEKHSRIVKAPAKNSLVTLSSLDKFDPIHAEPQSGALQIARWNDAFSVVAEAYRSTTFSILLTDDSNRRARIYVVSSPNAGEGKTTVTSNLGVALSKSKLRTVILDGDLRKPGMHNALRVDNNFGLRNLLRGELDAERSPIGNFCQATEMPNLFVIPAGTGSEEVVELLHSPHLAGLIDRLHREFDVVLIDTPPMLHMADARIFAHYAQGAILVLRAGVTSRDQAAKARDLFDRDRVRLVGTILNAFDPASEGQKNYYESYYRYKKQVEEAGEGGCLLMSAALVSDAASGEATPPGQPDLLPDERAIPTHVTQRLVGGTSALGASLVVERGAGFLANILAARLGGPATFGAYSLAITTANQISTYAAGGIGSTAARFSGKYPRGGSGYSTLARVLAIVSLASAVIAAFALWFGAAPIAHLLGKESLTPLLRWAALSVAGIIVLECARGFFVGQHRLRALVFLSVLVAVGMISLIPWAATMHSPIRMIVSQGSITITAVLICLLLARPLDLPDISTTIPDPLMPMLTEVWSFGFIQLAGLVGANLAGWWLTALVARSDTTLVQMSYFAIANQLRNIVSLAPAQLTESSYAVMADPASEQTSTPHHVMALCTYATTFASLLLASAGIVVMPWVLHLFWGHAYGAATVTTSIALAVAVVHMGNAPAAARLSIVSIRAAGVINTVWAIFVAIAATVFMLHRGSARDAMAIYLAGHLLSSTLVLLVLRRKDSVPTGMATVFALGSFTGILLAGFALLREEHTSYARSLTGVMFVFAAGALAALFVLGKRHRWLPSPAAVRRLLRPLSRLFGRRSAHGA